MVALCTTRNKQYSSVSDSGDLHCKTSNKQTHLVGRKEGVKASLVGRRREIGCGVSLHQGVCLICLWQWRR